MIKNKLKPKGAIKDFIWTKENTLSKEFCDHVIKKFDADPSKQDGIVGAKIQRVETGSHQQAYISGVVAFLEQ